MGFKEGNLPEAKLLGKEVFPKTLLPAAESDGNLAGTVATERESLVATLLRHGALLFRGFDVAADSDFECVVEAFGWDNFPLDQGANNRIKLSDRILTANESPVEQAISFHHEMGTRKSPPSKIFFYCSEPPPEGGETSIVAGDVVVERMEERMPEVMAKVAQFGLIHVMKTFADGDPSKGVLSNSWKTFLGTDDKVEAQKRAKQRFNCNATRIFNDGRAEFIFGPLNPIVERGGKRTWIFPLNGFADNVELVSNMFGDGDALPLEAIDIYRDILEESCVDIKWRKGDVLLLDNLAVQHARRPGKPPRRVLISMCM